MNRKALKLALVCLICVGVVFLAVMLIETFIQSP